MNDQTEQRQTVKLRDLIASDENPRKSMTAEGIEALAASIAADGILQNLVVRKKGKKYQIISGGRRYAALCLLRDNGTVPADFPVPVAVRSGLEGDDALRIATVENVQREQLTPLDEAEAFAGMARDGEDLATIAAKAGVSEVTVRRRLAIAGLCSASKDALRAGSISLAMAEALTLGGEAQQEQALEQLKRYNHDAKSVRRWFTSSKPSVADALFPLEMYEGTFTTDLFAEDSGTYFDDVPQFLELQRLGVLKKADDLRDAGQTVEIIEADHVNWWEYTSAKDGGGVTIIQLDSDGLVEVREGLVRKDAPEGGNGKEKVAKPTPEYTKPVKRYMGVRKTLAVQDALLKDARAAKIVAVAQMMAGGHYKSSLGGRVHAAHADRRGEDTPQETLASRYTALLRVERKAARYSPAIDALMNVRRDPVELFGALSNLTETALDELLVLLTVVCFGQSSLETVDTEDSLFNYIGQHLNIDMAKVWRPDEAFLSGRTTEQLVQIAHDSGASEVIGDTKGWKKAALVQALARYFERTDREGAMTWLPDAMRFDIVEEPMGPAELDDLNGYTGEDEEDDLDDADDEETGDSDSAAIAAE
jgi:ParB family chromosome partitioning protein